MVASRRRFGRDLPPSHLHLHLHLVKQIFYGASLKIFSLVDQACLYSSTHPG
ncbi:MAG TPA: hypothetical protein DD668_04595 [Alphaproteobacteria bacterium]|nr:hypothetical protein [Alphaproteobacteria bacterium]